MNPVKKKFGNPAFGSYNNIKDRHVYREMRNQRAEKRNGEIGRTLDKARSAKIELEKSAMMMK